jgi:hypothetical protein
MNKFAKTEVYGEINTDISEEKSFSNRWFLAKRVLVLTEDNSVHNSKCGNLTSRIELLIAGVVRKRMPPHPQKKIIFLIPGT